MIKVKREEFLLELSRKTLASYIKKASGSAPSKEAQSLPDAKAARREVGYGSPDWKKRHKKVISRMRGINRAADKLAKEEALQELSRKTLNSYIKQSATDRANISSNLTRDPRPNLPAKKDPRSRRYENRWVGLNRATDRLSGYRKQKTSSAFDSDNKSKHIKYHAEEKLSERMESYVDAINSNADFNTLRRTKN